VPYYVKVSKFGTLFVHVVLPMMVEVDVGTALELNSICKPKSAVMRIGFGVLGNEQLARRACQWEEVRYREVWTVLVSNQLAIALTNDCTVGFGVYA
jgi:hypothetical protein